MPHVLRPVLLALVIGLAVGVAPASAADVSFTGGGLTITGAPGEGSRLTVQADDNSRATVRDDADGLRPGPGCIGTPRQVVCEYLLAQQCHPCAATIDLGDASDTIILSGTPVKGPFLVDAGAGDDLVQIRGDANAIVRGGPGNDTLRADGLSELDGGEGADVLQGDRASASYVSRTAGVTVTLDGVANDGVLGEHDNAATGSVVGGDGADALTGNAAGNEISGRAGADFLAGEDGDDTLRAAGGGIDRVEAGAGDDIRDRRDALPRPGHRPRQLHGLVQPEQRRIGLPLTARGRALACRSPRSVRLLVIATGQVPLNTSSSATRRDARLPRIGRCARRKAKQR